MTGKAAAPILFSKIDGPFGCMSNFSPHPIRVDGLIYQTSEHFFQAMKFAPTPSVAEEIRATTSPMAAAMAGRSRQRPLRGDWDRVKEDVMELALLAKFSQHPDLHSLMLSTHPRRLVEHTRRDKYWGDGLDKGTGTCGKNRLGFLLEKVRAFFLEIGSRPSAISSRLEELLLQTRCGPVLAPKKKLRTVDEERRAETSAEEQPLKKKSRLE